MAEFVEFRCEEWIAELEKMERMRLFEPKEIKSLVTKRREFEYKIERRSKAKEDFLRYIQFEVDLLKIVNARREKSGITACRGEIEHKQIRRVIRLFKQIIFRFPNDIKLWMSLFKFCGDVNQHAVVSKMLARMLQIHSQNADMWVYASKWLLEHENSVDNARNFLTKGLRHHPSSDVLYLELFRLELENMKRKTKLKKIKIKKNKWNPDEVVENIICGKVVEVVYKSAIKVLDSADFKVQLLNVTKNYKIAINVQNMILQDLINSHPSEEITWDAIAKMEFKGITVDWSQLKEENETMDIDSQEKKKEKGIMRGRIERSINVYEEAVKKLNTSKMWNYYLDHVVEIYNNSGVKFKLPVLMFKILQNAMEGALNSNLLTEEYLLQWVEILKKSDKKNKQLEDVLEKGVQLYRNSLPLWHAHLRHHLFLDEEQKGKEIFRKAIENVPDGAPLWELMVKYYELKGSPELEETFEEGIRRRGEVAQALKPIFIEWLARSKGVEEARRVFETSELQHPPCLELIKAMIRLESSQPDSSSRKHVRNCHELACLYFGRNDPSVWLDFINWEKKEGDVTKVHQIHRRALNSLSPEKADEFLAEYSFIKMDVST